MNHKLLLAPVAALAALACAGSPAPTPATGAVGPGAPATRAGHGLRVAAAPRNVTSRAARQAALQRARSRHGARHASSASAAASPAHRTAPERQVGDFSVHRFSGSFAREPLLLTERVISREGATLVTDYTLEEGTRVESLRVRSRAAQPDEILGVAHLSGGRELPVDRAAFDRLMAKTVFVPDSNEALVASQTSTCLVGSQALPCKATTYAVSVGADHAVLTVLTSDQVPGRDLGGELIGANGATLYEARLVELGSAAPAVEGGSQASLGITGRLPGAGASPANGVRTLEAAPKQARGSAYRPKGL